MKSECIRVKTSLCLADGRRIVGEYVEYYNQVRLHSGIGYITPMDKLEGREKVIFAERDRCLEEARAMRKARRMEIRSAETRSPLWKASDQLTHNGIIAQELQHVHDGAQVVGSL